ncbi:MAG TPA: FtsW/RodA/SpoVE family cell cycle protein [Candidatus Faecousia excrementigallinarum]|uniref:FtsW/RodA/SpoVE family cell cycle protein n=1 Tax=Candidatus Faecousia excrementigallinarum TaxID=2840806 RepID=A0A9D0Z3R7_9FIRM|nr:FtsW/RodA/SpoVE family cell cycle protein [Candidatus Faecousia excrementigallinarum]
MQDLVQSLQGAESTFYYVFLSVFRYVAPALAFLILFRAVKPLLFFRRAPEIWAWLTMADGTKLPITHWENVIGRSKSCDVVLDVPTISRNHCVLTRYDDGSWTIRDTESSGGLFINGKRKSIWALQPEDVIEIGGVKMTLQPITQRQEERLAQLRGRAGSFGSSLINVLLLTIFQVLCCLGFLLSRQKDVQSVLVGIGGIMVVQWLLLLFYFCIRRTSFEVETIAFFISTMGMAAIAAVVPGEASKQFLSIIMGICAFLGIGWALRDLERAKKLRWLAAVAGIGFLLITLVFGTEINGAKNWLKFGSFSIQPSELSKVCFVFVGASTMDRILTKRNLIGFIAYSVAICGCLALMNDFGTALIFFCAFLVIAYMRSGSVGTIALACTSLGFAGVVALKIAPHAMQRFSSWRHIWESPLSSGYQQTRALMCMAAGGLFGLGAGQGYMKNVFAADSDMVVATITEEWGLLMVVMIILSIVALGVFVVRSAAVGRSSFYTIGACTAASILLLQTILNALGTVDVLPLTGVTFPFLSNGGSSMIGAWGLLAFIKAGDTRQNASFAVRLQKKGGREDE